jgi:SAM-dependent methyltransferase
MQIMQCKICGNTENNKIYKIKEMQLGLREDFAYLHCSNCGCMQLIDKPSDLSKYYPNQSYYSFTSSIRVPKKAGYLRRVKADYLIHGRHQFLGRILSLKYKTPEFYRWLKIPKVEFDDRILDVGSGNGALLTQLFKIGYTNLTGIDPFIDADRQYGGIKILKKDIYQLSGMYDYIMLNHSFEHMDEPLKVLFRLKELLLPNRYLLIRIPLMDTYGWKTYGLNWVALDAPRHLFIHTIESMKILAEKAGLTIKQVVFDSNPLDYLMSEQYQKNIAMLEPGSFFINKKISTEDKKAREAATRLAKKNDADGQGDQASFYLYKS